MVIFHSDPTREYTLQARPFQWKWLPSSLLCQSVSTSTPGERPVAFRGDRDATGLAAVVDEVMAGEELGVDLSPAFRVEPAHPPFPLKRIVSALIRWPGPHDVGVKDAE